MIPPEVKLSIGFALVDVPRGNIDYAQLNSKFTIRGNTKMSMTVVASLRARVTKDVG